MSIQQIQQDYAAQLNVRLLDSSDDPVTGVAFGSITATYKKHGDTSWTTKTVLTTDWEEGADGRYMLLFSAAELDTEGRFYFRVAASGVDTFTGDVDVVEDWATVVDMLQALIDGLSTKVPTASVKEGKQLQDQAILDANVRMSNMEDEIVRLEAVIAAIYRKINA